MLTMLDFIHFRGFSVVGWLFLEGQMWVGNNACYPLSAFDSFSLTFQGCLGLSGGMFSVLYLRFCSLSCPLVAWMRERSLFLLTCQVFKRTLG